MKEERLDGSFYKPRYIVRAYLIANAATPLSHPGIGNEGNPNMSKSVQVGGTEMSVPLFRRRQVLVNDNTTWMLPVINMKRRIREPCTNTFVRLAGINFGRFMMQNIYSCVFSIKDEVTTGDGKNMKPNPGVTTEEMKAALELDAAVKAKGWKYEDTQKRCGLLFTPMGMFGSGMGIPAKSKFPGDIFAYMTTSEVMDAPELKRIIEYVKTLDGHFDEGIKWLPTEEVMTIEGRTKRGKQERQRMFAKELAIANTTWLLSYCSSPIMPLTPLELENFVLGWREFARAPYVGAAGGMIDGVRLVLHVTDMEADDESESFDTYVGSWAALGSKGLHLELLGGSLGLDLHKNRGENLAKHVAVGRKHMSAIAPVTMSLGGMKVIDREVNDWYETCIKW